MTPHLRAAEWINLLAFSWLAALAWCRPALGAARRAKITAIGLAGLALTVFAAVALPRLAPQAVASAVRDWLPYFLLLTFYWQAGQFVTRVDSALESRLQRWDLRFVAPPFAWCAARPVGAWILAGLELAYLFCYIGLPLGLAALYPLGAARRADLFWATVLPATYVCYGLLPFVQTRSPRLLGEEWSVHPPRFKIRALNLLILRYASVRANVIPSAHVASSAACALVLLRVAPLWAGLSFLFIAFTIALGAVAGRYHYAADAVLGALAALAAAVTAMLFVM